MFEFWPYLAQNNLAYICTSQRIALKSSTRIHRQTAFDWFQIFLQMFGSWNTYHEWNCNLHFTTFKKNQEN